MLLPFAFTISLNIADIFASMYKAANNSIEEVNIKLT